MTSTSECDAVCGRPYTMDHERVPELEKIVKNGTENGICEKKVDVESERDSSTAFRRQVCGY